jgi:hypothetical protein
MKMKRERNKFDDDDDDLIFCCLPAGDRCILSVTVIKNLKIAHRWR